MRLATQQPLHLLLTDVVKPLLRGTKPFTPDALVAMVRQVLLAPPSLFARRTPH